ncbi:MAG: hypothetical protein WBN97_04515 [Parvibaculum sp.]
MKSPKTTGMDFKKHAQGPARAAQTQEAREKAARLAEALRENLKKRKAQSRGRQEEGRQEEGRDSATATPEKDPKGA